MERAVLNGFLPTAEIQGIFPAARHRRDRQHPRGSGKHLLARDEREHAGGFDSGDEGPGESTVTENDGPRVHHFNLSGSAICLFPRLAEHAIRWLIGI
jgi:hypothetical protein